MAILEMLGTLILMAIGGFLVFAVSFLVYGTFYEYIDPILEKLFGKK